MIFWTKKKNKEETMTRASKKEVFLTIEREERGRRRELEKPSVMMECFFSTNSKKKSF
jgi:hypothetical protein